MVEPGNINPDTSRLWIPLSGNRESRKLMMPGMDVTLDNCQTVAMKFFTSYKASETQTGHPFWHVLFSVGDTPRFDNYFSAESYLGISRYPLTPEGAPMSLPVSSQSQGCVRGLLLLTDLLALLCTRMQCSLMDHRSRSRVRSVLFPPYQTR